MNLLKRITGTALVALLFASCATYNAYQRAKSAEQVKDWDTAVIQYEKALEIDPDNTEYKMGRDRARREASRDHFEKAKELIAQGKNAPSAEQYRLAQIASNELQIVVRLDPSNQFAAVELEKVYQVISDFQRAATEQVSVDEVKKRAQSAITKAQPPQLNPASNEPISLTFSRDTPVKDIYRALGNAFGINILFDQAVKDDRITIELRDVTAQAALERVMQAANHFYKVLDEKTIIVIPDNPQARRDYEDLVIRTFYLSNGDAEQVTNVVRTMIEARNVFPLKALNAITIRDTADKVRIAEKIIEANDKAKAEVVVQVELVQLDLNRVREIGMAISGFANADGTISSSAAAIPGIRDANGALTTFSRGTLDQIAQAVGSFNALRANTTFAIPTATYSLLKTLGNSELLANPELRISEGEKATLHIGQRIPVPVTTISGYNPGQTGGTNNNTNLTVPYTSFQYQDVGIKVAMEPRVHHNREVTLKLTVEVSNQGSPVKFAGQEQPTFATRTIESTIRLKDGETNFLAGLIQDVKIKSATKTPILGDLPFIGRLFTNEHDEESRTDLVLTMTPHIIRIANITEEDVAPMWVGTGNNMTFRGVSPRVESQGAGGDPFVPARSNGQFQQLAEDGEPGNYIQPENGGDTPVTPQTTPPAGGAPYDPFKRPDQPQPPPSNNPPVDQHAALDLTTGTALGIETESTETAMAARTTAPTATDSHAAPKTASAAESIEPEDAVRFAPRIAPQPSTIHLGPGETKLWNVVGMDLDGLTSQSLRFQFDPRAMDISETMLGSAIAFDPQRPPLIEIDRNSGTITVRSDDGSPLRFVGGGTVLTLRVHGGLTGDTFLVMQNPDLHDEKGVAIRATIGGGHATVN
jgi:general secretion pathway protein D